jgi:hypothetical protein
VGWVLCPDGFNCGVYIGLVPIQARTDFHRLGQAAQFNIAVNGGATPATEFFLQVAKRKIVHILPRHGVRCPKLSTMRTCGLWCASGCRFIPFKKIVKQLCLLIHKRACKSFANL